MTYAWRKPPTRVRVGMLLRNPFFCAEFQQLVPDSHVESDGAVVRCTCGERYTLEVGELVECPAARHPDGLMRAFLRDTQRIRVARWEPVDEAA